MLSVRSSVCCLNSATLLLVVCGAVMLSGCGGSRGGVAGIITPPGGSSSPDNRTETATARFGVDVKTGQVSITPLEGSSTRSSGRAIFTGSAIQFSSSVLLDQPGDVGRKVLNVSLANGSHESIGLLPDGSVSGLRVLFSGFTNVGAFSDPRPRVHVSTIAGTGAAGSADGPAMSATFHSPNQAISDSAGNLYVTDFSENRVRKISGGLVSTLTGSGAAAETDGVGTAAALNAPIGIALNPTDGALIVTDYRGHRIRRITPDGRVTLLAGTGAAGGANGTGNVAAFNFPRGVAVDSNGVIYVSDGGSSRIRRITFSGGDAGQAGNYAVITLAGSGGSGFIDSVGTAASFSTPCGIAIGPDGALYVADAGNHAIRRVTTAGEVVTIAGTGTSGSANGSGEAASFNGPVGIAAVAGALIVSEQNSHTLRQIRLKEPNAAPSKANSWYVQLLAGATGSTGAADGDGTAARFAYAQMMGVSSSGAIYLADQGNQKIRKITPTGGFFPVGISTGAVPAEPVQLSNADGLIPVPANGSYLNFINYGGALAAGASSSTKPWSFIVPSGVTAFEFTVTVEAQTSILAPPESVNNGSGGGGGSPRVVVRTLTGGPASGYVDGSLAAARLYQPLSVAADAAGNLYVGDSNDAIRRIGTNGIVSTIAGSLGTGFADGPGNAAQFNSPRGITVNPEGTVIYVADQGNNRVRRIFTNDSNDTNPQNWVVSTIAGTGASGGTYFTARGDVATFNLPFGIVRGPGDNVYVSELNGNRIRYLRFTGGNPAVSTSWRVSLLAGDISATTGVTGDVDGAGSSARFNSPLGLALDNAGKLYVCDQGNHRIRVVTPDGVTSTLAGGISGDNPVFSYVDGPAVSGGVPVARFYFPFGIAVDSSGFIYVCDYFNYRIRRISPGAVVTTVAGTGVSGATDGPGNIAQFTNPDNIAVDPSGTLYVADRFNNSIRMIQRVISGP